MLRGWQFKDLLVVKSMKMVEFMTLAVDGKEGGLSLGANDRFPD